MNKKHILLSITGGSPSVLTETLYGIYKNNLTWPDEIHVITTQFGEKQLRLALFEKNEQDNNVIEQLCADYGIDNVPCFSSKQVHIVLDANNNKVDDARSEADQEALADYIVKAVAQLCDDSNNTIHASISGGRKTMTFYLGYAMTLFARKDDMLSHVLLTDPLYEIGDFFYPTPYSNRIKNYQKDKWLDTQNSDVDVVLSNIPFIRQRELMSKHVLSEFLKTDVLKLKKEADKKGAATTVSYADLVTYQSIAQTLELLQQRAAVETVERDKLKKKLLNAQKKREQFVLDKLVEKAGNKAFDIYQICQNIREKGKILRAINAGIVKELALFDVEFDLANKTAVVHYSNQLCKFIDFSNNELELAYYAMIARNSSHNGLRVDSNIGKKVENVVFPKETDKEPKHKDIHYGYLFLLELLRVENLGEDEINQIHEKFDREDKTNTLDLIKLIYDKYRNYLDPYRKTISSFLDFEISECHKYDIDKVDVQLVGIDKAFLRDRKKNLNGLITQSLSTEFNDIIAPTGVWEEDRLVSYYRGRSNPSFSDGLWITSNLID
ncbi:TIGR02584 family CRISPR-associated protein [Photobacterium kishitanii]|uniref:CRISPR-associated ring nuclease Csm6 n=1 Tax=Photobacterium kishitanii TaxID=318456 RepID=UPI000D151A33|nr:CRISPR-associated ring nuclease Csm6 [Photobacterium kishitanii]PSW62157.1 TIGR02584 family CRISPR-associated protein [Photobacterium kishitanii]